MEDLLIAWNKKLEIGIPKIDEQHKSLVELCAKLNAVILDKNVSEDVFFEHIKQALKECVEYVKIHFTTEEVLMKEKNYPGFVQHKKRHDEFTMKIITTSGKFSKFDKIEALRFVRFLYEWILTHIAHEDKIFSEYLKNS